MPRCHSASTSALARVDLPEPERPVIQTVQPRWPNFFSRSARVTVWACHVMFVDFVSDILRGPCKWPAPVGRTEEIGRRKLAAVARRGHPGRVTVWVSTNAQKVYPRCRAPPTVPDSGRNGVSQSSNAGAPPDARILLREGSPPRGARLVLPCFRSATCFPPDC